MKLATLNDGSRDGQLVVVSCDLGTAHHASAIATRLQQVLDDWNFLSPQLEDLSAALNAGKARHAFPFDPRHCLAPLPRAYRWVAAADTAATVPPLFERRSDALAGATEELMLAQGEESIDCCPMLVAVSGEIAAGASPTQALEGVRLLMLAADWSLPAVEQDELAAGLGLLHGRPVTAFAPVAVTPDELGDAWHDGRVHLPLQLACNGRALTAREGGADAGHDFGELLAELARRQPLERGSLVGSSPLPGDDPQRRIRLRAGDVLRIELRTATGASVFGAIEQRVAAAPTS